MLGDQRLQLRQPGWRVVNSPTTQPSGDYGGYFPHPSILLPRRPSPLLGWSPAGHAVPPSPARAQSTHAIKDVRHGRQPGDRNRSAYGVALASSSALIDATWFWSPAGVARKAPYGPNTLLNRL